MTDVTSTRVELDREELRHAIREEYALVADEPDHGFHFITGLPLAQKLGYDEALVKKVPQRSIESFAGTGNPFSLGPIHPGDHVVDVGSGAGTDSLIAAQMVGSEGRVVGVDMTDSMLRKSRQSAAEAGLDNVEFRAGYGEELPVPDEWASVIISNGVLNLMPDKMEALREMGRVLQPGGRLQIADILVEREVPDSARRQIDLWTG